MKIVQKYTMQETSSFITEVNSQKKVRAAFAAPQLKNSLE